MDRDRRGLWCREADRSSFFVSEIAEPGNRRRECTRAEIDAALAILDEGSDRISAASWPGALTDLDLPGLYSWWVDPDGAAMLTRGLGAAVDPGRIYAGLTGATKWPSGKAGTMTLRKRIGANHLRGTIRGSTFRRTLAASLRKPLGLVLETPGRLSRESEQQLSAWMREHLEVAVHPFAARDSLAHLEAEVLAALNPPLNLEGMPESSLRRRLRALRSELSTGGMSTGAAPTRAISPEP